MESSRELPLISVVVCFEGGAVHESLARSGLARATARMLRRGSEALDANAVEQRLDTLGCELSAQAGLGTTIIGMDMLARSREAATELLGELLAHPRFDAAELARLMRQSEAELVRARDDDGLLCSRAMRRNLFADHPHGRRVAGSIEGLRGIERQDVVDYHRRHFCRAGAVVAVAGDVSEDEAADIASAVTAALPEGAASGYPVDEPAAPRGRHLVVVDKPERSQSQLCIGRLGTHSADDDHIALLVANTAFGGTFSSRLVQEIRAKRGWSYGASSSLSTSRVREAFTMWTAPAAEDTAACLAVELEMLESFCQEGISAEELTFCKDHLRHSYAFEVDTARKRLNQKLERVLLGLPDDFHDRFVERVMAVTQEQANAAVRRRLGADDLWISVVATAGELEGPLREAIGDLADHRIEPYDLE